MIDILDVSSVQALVDYEKVRRGPVAPGVDRGFAGVIVKVSENENGVDPAGVKHLQRARAAGLVTGVYHFAHPSSDVVKQVENLYRAFGDTMPSMPIAIDLESAFADRTPAELVDFIRRTRDALAARAMAMMLYSYWDFIIRRLGDAFAKAADMAEIPLWLAWYGRGGKWYPKEGQLPPIPEPYKSAGKLPTIWQYSGGGDPKHPELDGLPVPGVPMVCDRNVFLGDEQAWHAFLRRPNPDQLEQEPAIVRPSLDFSHVPSFDDDA